MSICTRAVVAAVALSAAVGTCHGVPPAAAVDDGGATVTGDRLRAGRYSAPVDDPVADPFRAPRTPYGPGNRGLEYATARGESVRAIGDGTVVFAGQVAGRLVVSVEHPDGLRSSVVGLSAIAVVVGQGVVRGQVLGRSSGVLHLGVRRNGTYLDPATLFGRRGPARLVPLGPTPQRRTALPRR